MLRWTLPVLALAVGCGPRDLGSFGPGNLDRSEDASGEDDGPDDGGRADSGVDAGIARDAGDTPGEPDAAPPCPGGGPEVCDGVDNDCDGRIDVEDGVPLASHSRLFAQGSSPAIAWAPGAGRYGVTYLLAGEVWFRGLDGGGEPLGEPYPVGIEQTSAHHTAIAWGGDAFGVTWSGNGQLAFRRLSAEGWILGDPLDVAPGWSLFGSSEVVRVGEAEWLVLFECCRARGSLYGRRIDAAGVVLEPLETVHAGPGNRLTGVAVSGEQLGIAWWRDSASDPLESFVEWTRRTGWLAPVDDAAPLLAQAVAPGKVEAPRLAALSDGYAVAWRETRGAEGARHLLYAELDREGDTLCGPVDLSESYPRGALPLEPRDMVATERGALLLGEVQLSESEHAVDLVEVRRSCQYAQRFRVGASKSRPFAALASAGVQGLAVLWQDYFEASSHIMQRTLPPTLCTPAGPAAMRATPVFSNAQSGTMGEARHR